VIGQQCKQITTKNEDALVHVLSGTSKDTRRTIQSRGKDTGMWLSISPSTVNGTELSAQEFPPPDVPTHCNGCYKSLDLRHALECKKGGLVICRHNEIKDKLVALTAKAFTHSAIHDEPRIHPGCTALAINAPAAAPRNPVIRLTRRSQEADRGDILI
jgi:hypothetical protein